VTTLKAGKDASMTAHYRGVSITDNIAPPIVVGFSYMNNDTTTCDACGTRYAFTSVKDRCPVCCPVEDNESDEYEQTDWEYDGDD
jgi:anaerobic ribonucleoside-triphosphate reductase